jgi:hypothetical protein
MQTEIKLGCLVSVVLADGRIRRFQNWDWKQEALAFQGYNYKYFNFPIPPLQRIVGERSETVSLILPLVGASEYGYFPIREWLKMGVLSNAIFQFKIFDFEATVYQHTFVTAEVVTQRTDGQSVAEFRLRQADDKTNVVMTSVYNYKTIGESPSYSAF